MASTAARRRDLSSLAAALRLQQQLPHLLSLQQVAGVATHHLLLACPVVVAAAAAVGVGVGVAVAVALAVAELASEVGPQLAGPELAAARATSPPPSSFQGLSPNFDAQSADNQP